MLSALLSEPAVLDNLREKFRRLGNSSVCNRDVQSAPFLDCRIHERFARFWVRHIASDFNELSCRTLLSGSFAKIFGFFNQAELLLLITGEAKMVDGYVGTLPEVLECDCATDPTYAASNTGCLSLQ